MKDKHLTDNHSRSANSKLYLLVILSSMTAFAPLVTDMYLPSLPALTGYFATSASMVQLTISTSMIGIAVGQLFFGPISDKTGRLGPLYASLGLYMAATVGCIFSPDIYLFITFRLLQGLGAAGSIVLARSIAADLFTGGELLSFLALMAAVQGIAPIAAPVVGGVLLIFTSWKGVFVILGALGVAIWVMSLWLKESLPRRRRIDASLISTLRFFVPVLRNRLLMLYIALLSFSTAIMFAYIASSPFIFQQHYGVSPIVYSVIFAVNAVGLTIGNVVSARMGDPHRTLKRCVAGMFVFSLSTGVTLLLELPLIVFCVPLFLTLLFAGGTFPLATNMALDLERQYKGTASATLGACTFLAGGAIMPLAGLGNILHSTAAAMAASATIALIMMMLVGRISRFDKPDLKAVPVRSL
ncbi:Bcr/CflA family drug resistance efflux transporter [Bacteroidia bacterium]|nr:Bcr/CflA family drug resistance efflux transporter [Bacteroidia bacterium]